MDFAAQQDQTWKQEAEDALRSEWGGEFRRNQNLIQGLIDFTGGNGKSNILEARMPDGRRVADSPDAMKQLLGVALIQNPTGVVVPGGGAGNSEGIRSELEKLQKISADKKTPAQSARERDLYDAAISGGFMDNNGNWKK